MQSPIYREAMSIAGSPVTNGSVKLTLEIESPDGIIKPYTVLTYDVNSDHHNNLTDIIFVKVLMGYGDYIFDVYPNKELLYGTLSIIITDAISGNENEYAEAPQRIARYKMEIAELIGTDADNKFADEALRDSLNRENPVEVVFELINPFIVHLSMSTLETTLRSCRTDDAIAGLLSLMLGQIDMEEDYLVKYVDMVKGENDEIRESLVIPAGKAVKDIPTYIHNHCGGVYDTGIGSYIQGNCWYVYPKLNRFRFEATTKTLTIFNLPPELLSGVENTYVKNGDGVKIISTGLTKEIDRTDEMLLKLGNGVRYYRGWQFMNGFTTQTKTNATITHDTNMREYLTHARKTGINYAPLLDERITSNHLKVMSDMAGRSLRPIILTWEHSDPDLLYPGMPVKYHHISDADTSVVKTGVLANVVTNTTMKTNTITDNEFKMNSVLTIYV